MKIPLMSAAAVTVAALVLTACGGGGGGSPSSTPSAPAGSSTTVSVKQVPGLGRVLVDASGRALYSPEQEADGKVRCDGGCTSIWEPLKAGAKTPSGPSSAGTLGVLKRPDGTAQVTAGGKPLYTFTEDAPGKVTGNGFKDAFGGTRFTWHAVLASGKAAGAPGTSGTSGGGYGPGGY